MSPALRVGVNFCLVVVTADCSTVFGRIFLNSRYRHDDDLGQLSHAVSHHYTRHQLLALRFDEHRGRVRQCTFDFVAQFGLLRYRSCRAGRRVRIRVSHRRSVTSSAGHVYQQQRLPTVVGNRHPVHRVRLRTSQRTLISFNTARASHFLKQFTAAYLLQDRTAINTRRS